MNEKSIYEFTMNDIDNNSVAFDENSEIRSSVNSEGVASKCREVYWCLRHMKSVILKGLQEGCIRIFNHHMMMVWNFGTSLDFLQTIF